MTSALLQPADLPAAYQAPAAPPSSALPALLRGPKTEALLRGPKAEALPRGTKGDALPHTAPAPDALHTPRVAINFAAVHADIAAERATDALIDAEDLLAELQSRLRDLRGMPPATAALLFGSDAAWRQALARVAVAAGRQLTGVEALRAAVGVRLRGDSNPPNTNPPDPGAAPAPSTARVDVDLNEIARPIASGTRVQWTGD